MIEELADVYCPEKPELLLGAPIGQYHCPGCGVMVLAGLKHPPIVLLSTGDYDYKGLADEINVFMQANPIPPRDQ